MITCMHTHTHMAQCIKLHIHIECILWLAIPSYIHTENIAKWLAGQLVAIKAIVAPLVILR